MGSFLLGFVSSSALIGVVIFLLKHWIVERLKSSLQKELEQFKAELLWDRKIREEAAKVAKYLSIAQSLSEHGSSREDFALANQLSWELAMWLPEDIYKATVQSIVHRTQEINELSTVIRVRKLLLKDKSGNLTQNDIAIHAPGIGKACGVSSSTGGES